MTTITVTGLKELDERLKLLSQVAGQKVMRSALWAAAKPIMDHAKMNVRKDSGALAYAITRFYKVNSLENSGSRFTVSVGPKPKNRTAIALYNMSYKRARPIRGIFYGHLIEFGHLTRPRLASYQSKFFINKRGSVRLKKSATYDRSRQTDVAAHPFLVPALQSRFPEATRLLADKLKAEIDKRLKP